MASSTSIQINPDNIVMTFNKYGKLLGLGKTNAGVVVIDVPVQKSMTGEIDLGDSADAVNKYKKTVAKALLSTDFKKGYEKGEGVIVKLQVGAPGSEKFLYIPGAIAAEVSSPAANATVIVGDGKAITDVPLTNICTNYKLKVNESGFFFSDIILASNLGDKKYSDITEDHLNKIIAQGSYSIFTTNDPGPGGSIITRESDKDYYINHNAFTIGTGNNSKQISTSDKVSTKSVVPMGFNNVNDINNPSQITLTTSDKITDNTVVFGGKKSKKQKTRKNTMPLQFAPGAKRAYLKRRKSSRK